MKHDHKAWWHHTIPAKDVTCMECKRFPEDYHEWFDLGDKRLCYDCFLDRSVGEGSTVH